MRFATSLWCLSSLGALGLSSFTSSNTTSANGTPVVSVAPDFVRPYVLPKYHGRAIRLTPTQVLRYSITTNSTGGAFALVQHNGQTSPFFSARAHTHHEYSEHFYCSKGQHLLWMQKNETGATQEARLLAAGDYAWSPPNTIHNFQMADPDSQITHVFYPGGFEKLFDVYSHGDFESSTHSPYLPIVDNIDPFPPITNYSQASNPSLDLYIVVGYEERRDLINGAAGSPNLTWHDGPNTVPANTSEPYFIAKNFGPRFLNAEHGYSIINPLTAPDQNSDNITMGTIIMSPKLANQTLPTTVLPHHFALQMEEGQLVLSISGYDEVAVLQGDVVFIPSGTPFTYYAAVPYTKFMYVNAGHRGLDYQLLQKSEPWAYTAYPERPGYIIA